MIRPTMIAIVGKAKSGKTRIAKIARDAGFHVVEFGGRIVEFQELQDLKAKHDLLLVTRTIVKRDCARPVGSVISSVIADEVWEVSGGSHLKLTNLKSRRCTNVEDILV